MDNEPYCERKFEQYLPLGTLPEGYLEQFGHCINYIDNYAEFYLQSKKQVYKIYIDCFSGDEILKEMDNRILEDKSISTVFSYHKVLDILPSSVNKGEAIKYLCEHLNIETSNVLAIGDSNNDIEMLQTANYSVAMGGANDKVKAAAKYITYSNFENGVYEAISNIVYKK